MTRGWQVNSAWRDANFIEMTEYRAKKFIVVRQLIPLDWKTGRAGRGSERGSEMLMWCVLDRSERLIIRENPAPLFSQKTDSCTVLHTKQRHLFRAVSTVALSQSCVQKAGSLLWHLFSGDDWSVSGAVPNMTTKPSMPVWIKSFLLSLWQHKVIWYNNRAKVPHLYCRVSEGWFFLVYSHTRISSANDFPSPYITRRDWNFDQALVSSSQIAMPFPPGGVPPNEEGTEPVLIKQIWDTSIFRKEAVVVLWWLLIPPMGKKSTKIFHVNQWPQPGWLEMLSCCLFTTGAEQKGPSISDCRYFARGRNSLWGFKLPILEAFLIIKGCRGNYNCANFFLFFSMRA